MGQSSSIFIYSPLEFVEYKNTSGTDMPLESFIMMKLQANLTYKSLIDSIAHKIRCISEGWEVMPKIHFEIIHRGTSVMARVAKVLDGV